MRHTHCVTYIKSTLFLCFIIWLNSANPLLSPQGVPGFNFALVAGTGNRKWPGLINASPCGLEVTHGVTHGGRDKIDAILQTTFSNAISWMKMFEFRLKFHWSLFLKVQLTIFQHWFRLWLDAEQATSHYLNQWWPSSTTHICVTRPQWVNSLWSITYVRLSCHHWFK